LLQVVQAVVGHCQDFIVAVAVVLVVCVAQLMELVAQVH
jgi:hypothetical protein